VTRPSLQYEPHAGARPVIVEQPLDGAGGVTRIVVPMPGLYIPLPRWLGDLDVLAVVVVPCWSIATLLIRTCLRLTNPPRAVFEVSAARVTMRLHNTTGEVQTFDWPRAAVVELRANRFEAGLWTEVTGHVKETYLSDLPRGTIEKLEAALGAALTPPANS
jgi:hypothetical protein